MLEDLKLLKKLSYASYKSLYGRIDDKVSSYFYKDYLLVKKFKTKWSIRISSLILTYFLYLHVNYVLKLVFDWYYYLGFFIIIDILLEVIYVRITVKRADKQYKRTEFRLELCQELQDFIDGKITEEDKSAEDKPEGDMVFSKYTESESYEFSYSRDEKDSEPDVSAIDEDEYSSEKGGKTADTIVYKTEEKEEEDGDTLQSKGYDYHSD